MDSSQASLAKLILQPLIVVFGRFLSEELPTGLVNYTIHLLAQQLVRRIHLHQEETTRYAMVMRT